MPIQQVQSDDKQVAKTIASDWFVQAIDKIEKKFALHIDQSGELYMIVSEIMLGNTSSQDFINNVMTRMEVDEKMANEIALETNAQIFNVLKNTLQTQQVDVATGGPDLAPLERMGGITIEKPEPESENKMVTSADRGNILAGLENPPSSTAHTSQPPQNLPVVEEEAGPFSETSAAKSTKKEESHTEPLVDLLLSKPAGQSMQNVVATPTAVQKPKITVPTPKSSGGPDPYREPIK